MIVLLPIKWGIQVCIPRLEMQVPEADAVMGTDTRSRQSDGTMVPAANNFIDAIAYHASRWIRQRIVDILHTVTVYIECSSNRTMMNRLAWARSQQDKEKFARYELFCPRPEGEMAAAAGTDDDFGVVRAQGAAVPKNRGFFSAL